MPSRLSSPRAAAVAAIVVGGVVAAVLAGVGMAASGDREVVQAPTAGAQHHEARDPETSVNPDQEAADAVVAAMKEALVGYADVAAAESVGYFWIGDGGSAGEYRHYIQPGHLASEVILEPAEVESLVYQTNDDGTLTLVSGMFILPPGSTMAEVPDVAGDLTVWHDHTDLCFARDGTIAATTSDGTCPDGSRALPTPPMLHVWVVDHPGGPFAGIEDHGGH